KPAAFPVPTDNESRVGDKLVAAGQPGATEGLTGKYLFSFEQQKLAGRKDQQVSTRADERLLDNRPAGGHLPIGVSPPENHPGPINSPKPSPKEKPCHA